MHQWKTTLIKNLDQLFCLGYQITLLIYHVKCHGWCLSSFDVSMDISQGKFISGKSSHTHHTNFPL